MSDLFIGNAGAKESLFELVESRSGLACLLFGPQSVGKHTLARLAAAHILGRTPKVVDPDLLDISAELGEQKQIDLATAKRIAKHVTQTPFAGERSVTIIARIERITREAANALLIPLESLPASACVIMTSDNPAAVIPTIKSRALPIGLSRVSEEEMTRGLQGRKVRQQVLEEALKLARGAPGRALTAAMNTGQRTRMAKLQQAIKSWEQETLVVRLALALKHGSDQEKARGFLLEMLSVGPLKYRQGANRAYRRLEQNVQPRAVLEAFAMIEA